MLNFNHVYYFHVTATEGSVKAAAERLGVTQPTVSEQVRLLEKSLGVTLFERGPTGLRLTPIAPTRSSRRKRCSSPGSGSPNPSGRAPPRARSRSGSG